ncbi:MAG: GNAT family N-acetyltransferase [Turicibacter sp.]
MKIEKLNIEGNTYKEAYLDLMSYCFNPSGREYFEGEFVETTPDLGTILGIVDTDGAIASSVTILNKEIYLGGQAVKMGGIACVASMGHHRSGGVVSRLMKESLKIMNEQNMVFSMLGPFKYEFYEKFGYKLCFEKYECKVPIEQLKSFKNTGTYQVLNDKSLAEIKEFHQAVCVDYNGCCLRTDRDWNRSFNQKENVRGIIYRNPTGVVEGYMVYKISPDEKEFNVNELIFTTPQAVNSLLSFIYLHEAQTKQVNIQSHAKDYMMDRLKNPSVEWEIHPGMMGRIVNVSRALTHYQMTGTGSVVINVSDKQCEWNHHSYQIDILEGVVVGVSVTDACPQLEIDILELTQLVMGYRTLLELVNLGTVSLLDESILNHFKVLKSNIALYDFF